MSLARAFLSGLLSWVLLQPPVQPDGVVVFDAPLADWVVNGRYPTAAKCEDTRAINLAALAYGIDKDGGGGPGTGVLTQARCMSVEQLKKTLGAPKPSDEDY